jgi:hypothetical protein
MSEAKLFRCLICHGRFSEHDVELLNYFPVEMVCYEDYVKGTQQDHRMWCFGKKNVIDVAGRITRYGFDPQNSEDCRRWCDDRRICALFVTGRIYQYRKLLAAKLPFKPGYPTVKAFVSCIMGTTRDKLEALIRGNKGDPAQILALLRQQQFKGLKWTFIEKEDGRIRIRI